MLKLTTFSQSIGDKSIAQVHKEFGYFLRHYLIQKIKKMDIFYILKYYGDNNAYVTLDIFFKEYNIELSEHIYYDYSYLN